MKNTLTRNAKTMLKTLLTGFALAALLASGCPVYALGGFTYATTTSLASTPNPSAAGQSVTLRASVSPGPGGGTVTFRDASTSAVLGTAPVNNGAATLSVSNLAAGTHTLIASFGGYTHTTISKNGTPPITVTYKSSTSGPLTQKVGSTMLAALTSSVNPSIAGQTVTFTAVVTAPSGGPTPTGAVQFAFDGVSVGDPVTLDGSGQAAITEAALAPGTHSITATYTSADGSVSPTVFTLTQVVIPHVSPQYVSPTGSDSSDGSHDSPKLTIQAGINATLNGDMVTVEEGTYTGPGDVDLDFGGRNITVTSQNGAATTVIDCASSSSALHRGFYFHSGETSAVVSGLTVQNGYEDSQDSNLFGYAGAVAIASGSAVTLTHCLFTGNHSALQGGAVYNAGRLTLTDCAFTGNATGALGSGGGLYNSGTVVSATNCIFTGNIAAGSVGEGGAITNAGPAAFVNCTLTGNSADTGAGLFNTGNGNGTLTLTNDIFYGDVSGPEYQGDTALPTATCCDGLAGLPGTGNISVNPLFVNAATGDLHLRPGSPCIGAGTRIGAPAADLDGKTRSNPPGIGAYDIPETAQTQILWTNANGQASLWNIGSDGSLTMPVYGPFPGWRAVAVSDGPNGTKHILWINTSGEASIWNVSATGSVTSHEFGPFTGYKAMSLSTGADDISHLLWNRKDGLASLWALNSATGTYTHAEIGPFPGWTANAVASGQNVTGLLWTNTNGAMVGYRYAADGTLTQQEFGPYPGWGACALSVGPDDMAHPLWNNSDGHVCLWSAGFAGSGIASTGYGPYSGWYAQAVATGLDNVTHLLWNHAPDNQSSVWTISGGKATATQYGPFSGWQAVAVSAGP